MTELTLESFQFTSLFPIGEAEPAGQVMSLSSQSLWLSSGPSWGSRPQSTGTTLALFMLDWPGSKAEAEGGKTLQRCVLTSPKQLPSSDLVPDAENIFLDIRGPLLLNVRPQIKEWAQAILSVHRNTMCPQGGP